MARMNTISDGQPFTYQLLNQIIESINAIKEPEEGNEDLLEIIGGPGSGVGNSKNKPLIIFGSNEITIPENQTSADRDRVNFSGSTNFVNDNPIVLATLVDPEAGGNVPVGYLVITKVTNSNFAYRVKLLRKRSKSTTVRVNYVAFGYTSK